MDIVGPFYVDAIDAVVVIDFVGVVDFVGVF